MKLQGYNVDKNLPAFRKWFALSDILEALDHQFAVIWDWINGMCDLPHLPEAAEQFARVREAMNLYYGDCSGLDTEMFRISDSACNEALVQQMNQWSENVKPEMLPKYQTMCFVLHGLMDLAEYSSGKEDWEKIREFLEEQELFKKKCLSIRMNGKNNPGLYYGNTLVTGLPGADREKNRQFGVITMSAHPDTGYLGISKDGRLINGSAFLISSLEKRPVKVLSNQMCYVILLEDGTLVHNLRFSKLPEGPVRDVKLVRDQLSWTKM